MSTEIRIVDVNGGATADFISSTLVNGYSAMSIPAWRRAIDFLSSNLASLPRAVHLNNSPAEKQGKPHPLDKILNRRPNSYAQTPFVLFRTWYAHATHTGNGYMRIARSGPAFQPTSLHNLMPHDVCPVRWLPEGATEPMQYYLIQSTRQVLPAQDVLHLQGLSYDGQKGTDPIGQHEATFQFAHTLMKFQTYFLRKGTVVRGCITIPAGANGEVTPTEVIDQVQNILRRHYYGEAADRDVLVLGNGAALSNTTLTPQQSQIVEQGAITTKQIAQITGVHPFWLFDDRDGKYNATASEAGTNLVRYTLRTWFEQAEDEMTCKLLTDEELDAGYKIRINPDALVRGSTKEQMDVVTNGVRGGVYTSNDGREQLGMPRVEDPEADRLKVAGAAPAAVAPDTKPGEAA